MKKFLIITVIVTLSLSLFAESFEEKMEKFGEEMEEFGQEMEAKMTKIAEESGETITIEIDSDEVVKSDSAWLGVYPKDLSLSKVRELKYDLNYGVLITATVKDGPAFNQKIYKNDIIYEIDGRQVIDNDSFTDILKAYKADETVDMKIFSNGEHKNIKFTFGRRKQKKITVTTDSKKEEKKKGVDWNTIAINWIPRYYQMDDIDDVNGMMDQMGFSNLDEGLFMNGFGFRIHVSNGFYLGGEWSWFDKDRKNNHEITDENGNVTSLTRTMDYENSFAGVTLDKRFYFTKYFQPGIGFLLGGGSQKIKFTQSDGNYDWNDFSADFDNSANNSMSMSREYVVFQPRADLYIPILSWVGIRGEASYLMGYSKDSNWSGSNYEITNSPETRNNGWAFSVGPWIEF